MEIYFPATCNVLVRGHIKALEILNRKGFVTVGLLTSKAMKGYKKELTSFEDRKYILDTIAMALGNIDVIPQDSLDPTENIKKYKCNAIASGDGWHPKELRAIKKLNLKKIEFDSKHRIHSSDLWKKI